MVLCAAHHTHHFSLPNTAKMCICVQHTTLIKKTVFAWVEKACLVKMNQNALPAASVGCNTPSPLRRTSTHMVGSSKAKTDSLFVNDRKFLVEIVFFSHTNQLVVFLHEPTMI